MLSLRNISKVFSGDENGLAAVPAVDDISVEVRAGEFFSIIGPSGCGKSTMLRIIGGLISSTGGELTVDGEMVKGPHRSIAMVFQEESTFPWRTTLANVEFGLEMRGVGQAQRRKKAADMIRLVGLSEFEKRYPSELSGGMRQRVASAFQIATRVYLPAIAGQIFTGVRIGLGAAVTGALLAETKIARAGLGFMIVEYYGQFRIADMYSLLLFIFILAALVNWAMKTLFSLMTPPSRTNQDAALFF